MGLRDVCMGGGGGPDITRPRTAPGALALKPKTAAAAPADDAPKTNIVVAVRVRPKNAREAERDDPPVVKAMDEHVVVFDPNIEIFTETPASKRRVPGSRRSKEIQYAFDRVFGEEATQREVYEGTAKGLVDYVLDGYNATVFAYGATGSGKTFTMIGNEQFGQGVMVSTLSDLFQKIEERKLYDEYTVRIAYLEIYNEMIRDLLDPQGAQKHPLELREDQKGETVVSGLQYHALNSAEKVFEMLEQGNARRTQSPTEANANSSRSHAVLQILVEKRARGAIQQEVKLGKLSMIDLAGSERAAVTANRGKLLREGANINQSLLALGNCINALCSNKKGTFVPYRNSKLTRFLRDSLGGNCKTVMIAAVSPSQLSYEDTHNTLKYANRAKDIKTKVVANVISVQAHITEYRRKMAELQAQNDELRRRLRELEKGEGEALEGEQFAYSKAELERLFGQQAALAEKLAADEAARLQLDFENHTQAAALAREREALGAGALEARERAEREQAVRMAEVAVQRRKQEAHERDVELKATRRRLEETERQFAALGRDYVGRFTNERKAYFERAIAHFAAEARGQAARREGKRSEETYKYVRDHAKALAAACKQLLNSAPAPAPAPPGSSRRSGRDGELDDEVHRRVQPLRNAERDPRPQGAGRPHADRHRQRHGRPVRPRHPADRPAAAADPRPGLGLAARGAEVAGRRAAADLGGGRDAVAAAAAGAGERGGGGGGGGGDGGGAGERAGRGLRLGLLPRRDDLLPRLARLAAHPPHPHPPRPARHSPRRPPPAARPRPPAHQQLHPAGGRPARPRPRHGARDAPPPDGRRAAGPPPRPPRRLQGPAAPPRPLGGRELAGGGGGGEQRRGPAADQVLRRREGRRHGAAAAAGRPRGRRGPRPAARPRRAAGRRPQAARGRGRPPARRRPAGLGRGARRPQPRRRHQHPRQRPQGGPARAPARDRRANGGGGGGGGRRRSAAAAEREHGARALRSAGLRAPVGPRPVAARGPPRRGGQARRARPRGASPRGGARAAPRRPPRGREVSGPGPSRQALQLPRAAVRRPEEGPLALCRRAVWARGRSR